MLTDTFDHRSVICTIMNWGEGQRTGQRRVSKMALQNAGRIKEVPKKV